MSRTPQIEIEGLYDSSGSLQGSSLGFWTAESAKDDVSIKTERESVPTLDSEDALISPFKGSQDLRYQAKAVPRLLLAERGYPDRVSGVSEKWESLINYLLNVESLVQEEQGIGYRINDRVRGKEYIPPDSAPDEGDGRAPPGYLIDSVTWKWKSDEPKEADITVEATQGTGVQSASSRSNYIDGEYGRIAQTNSVMEVERKRDGLRSDLGHAETIVFEREVDIDKQDLLLQFEDSPNVGLVESGAKTDITVQGKVRRADIDTSLTLGDAAIRLEEEYKGEEVIFTEPLTLRTFTGAISEISTTYNEKETQSFDYSLDFQQGTVPIDLK